MTSKGSKGERGGDRNRGGDQTAKEGGLGLLIFLFQWKKGQRRSWVKIQGGKRGGGEKRVGVIARGKG